MEKVIVITGASSGNGKAAALKFASLGASVVLAARRLELLEELAVECESVGGKALAVKTDVTNFADVQRLYDSAIERFGHIDVWINNAGVLAFGSLLETPPEISRQVVNINLIGSINGAHVAVPHFMERKQGILITMNSLSAFVPTPFVAAYSASKVGLRGFTEALRYELSLEKNIHVCDIFATFLDTTGLDHAANLTGRKLAPPPPLYDPCKVAEVMVSLVEKPVAKVTLGANAHLARFTHAIMPAFMGRAMARITKTYLKRAPKELSSSGNLFRPVWTGKGVHGGWGKSSLGRADQSGVEDQHPEQ